jgi:alkanesulfonate monooxygenase SsuD/methylene tetrahydromethanopterin reductase-like flavin-dependent oxidoreductase (luciferase family)
MAEEFLSDSTGSVRPNSEPEQPKRQPIRYIIVSSPEQVRQQILKFHKMGLARVDEWSPLQQAQREGEVMAILTRYPKPPSDSSTRKSGR